MKILCMYKTQGTTSYVVIRTPNNWQKFNTDEQSYNELSTGILPYLVTHTTRHIIHSPFMYYKIFGASTVYTYKKR